MRIFQSNAPIDFLVLVPINRLNALLLINSCSIHNKGQILLGQLDRLVVNLDDERVGRDIADG